MPSKPNRRSVRAKRRREVVSADAVAKLFDVGPYDRNQVTLGQINRLRDLIELAGLQSAAERVGVCDVTLLRVTSGFGHKLRPETAARVRAFFGEKE